MVELLSWVGFDDFTRSAEFCRATRQLRRRHPGALRRWAHEIARCTGGTLHHPSARVAPIGVPARVVQAHGSGFLFWLDQAQTRAPGVGSDQSPTGQCRTSSMGKSFGLPVAS